MVRTFTVACLLISLAACVEGVVDPEGPTYGLGLQIPSSFPPPGNLVEQVDQLAQLEAFLANATNQYRGRCTRYPEMPDVEEMVEKRLHLDIPATIVARRCVMDAVDEGKKIAEESNRTKRLNALAAMAQEANRIVSQAEQNASAAGLPSSLLQLEFLGALQIQILNARDKYDSGLLRFEKARNESSTKNASEAAWAFFLAYAFADVADWFLQPYPWNQTECDQAKLDRTIAVRRNQLQFNLNTYEEFSMTQPEHSGDIYAAQSFLASLNYHKEHSFLGGIAVMGSQVDWSYGYAQNLTARPLPTQDEARFLIALLRSNAMSLRQEQLVSYFAETVDDPVPWEIFRGKAVNALSLPSLTAPAFPC